MICLVLATFVKRNWINKYIGAGVPMFFFFAFQNRETVFQVACLVFICAYRKCVWCFFWIGRIYEGWLLSDACRVCVCVYSLFQHHDLSRPTDQTIELYESYAVSPKTMKIQLRTSFSQFLHQRLGFLVALLGDWCSVIIGSPFTPFERDC